MKKGRLSELHDSPRFPASIREFMTDFLAFFSAHFFQYNPVFPVIKKVLDKTEIKEIKDFCSGSGDNVLSLERFLNKKNSCGVNIELTDKFPNLTAFKRIAEKSGGTIRFHGDVADAISPHPGRHGFRVMFSATHHFSMEELESIIRNAVDNESAIGFFDYASRNHFKTLLLMPGLIPLVLCITPFLRPFRWTRLLFTYIFPIVPLVLFIDGFISRWNGYGAKDFVSLAKKFERDKWICEYGTEKNFLGTGEVVWFVCYKPFAGKDIMKDN